MSSSNSGAEYKAHLKITTSLWESTSKEPVTSQPGSTFGGSQHFIQFWIIQICLAQFPEEIIHLSGETNAKLVHGAARKDIVEGRRRAKEDS